MKKPFRAASPIPCCRMSPCRVGSWPAVLGADGSLWTKGNPAASSCGSQHMVQQKPFLLSCNSGCHSHALTHVLLFLQPVEELRETALNILKNAGQKLEGNLSVVGLTGAWAGRGSLVLPAGKQLMVCSACPSTSCPS